MKRQWNILIPILIFFQEEFLLSGPTDTLGMFVTSQGTSLRPPLSWTDGLIALGYCFPYVVAVGRGTITVYRLVQEIHSPCSYFHSDS